MYSFTGSLLYFNFLKLFSMFASHLRFALAMLRLPLGFSSGDCFDVLATGCPAVTNGLM